MSDADKVARVREALGFVPTVICRAHGRQSLTQHQYEIMLDRPDDFWRCPICNDNAEWDDSCLPE